MLPQRLNALCERIRNVSIHETDGLNERLHRMRARGPTVEQRLAKLDPQMRNKALLILAKEIEEVLFCFEKVATRLEADEIRLLESGSYRDLVDKLAEIMNPEYQSIVH